MVREVLTYQSNVLFIIPEIHTDVLWDLSVLFGSLCLLYFGFIFFFRNRLSAKSRNINDRRKQLTPIISNFIFYGEEATKEEKYEYVGLKVEMREFIKDPINRSILKEILLDLQRDLTGDARQRLLKLYQDFDLHLDAYNKLKSWRWEIATKGIVELTQMQVVQAYPFIKKYINHKKSVIRRHAQIATVSLKPEGIGHFLDSNKYSISEWQQIKILELLRTKDDYIPPKFGAWLTSKNKDVVLFSLRLIRNYNQIDAKSSIIELLKHKDDEVKRSAIICIDEFGFKEAIPVLMAAFKRSQRETKLMILDALGNLGTDEIIPYLNEVYLNEPNFNVRSKALGAINTICPETILPKENLDPNIKVPVSTIHKEPEIETTSPETIPEEITAPTLEEEKPETRIDEDVFLEEDLEIFELCFMEELNEILADAQADDRGQEVKYLPLDFLPVVVQKPTEMAKKNPTNREQSDFYEFEVIYEEIHSDDHFRKELEDILSRVEVPDLDGNIEVEYLNFKFLPFVMQNDQEDEGNPLPDLIKEINEMEVNGVEIVIPNFTTDNNIESDADPGVDREIQEIDAGELIDWEEIELLSEQDPREVKDANVQESEHIQNYGFSIFEELFRHCDTDSKLILLDEILDLGDSKELSFLKSLQKDPNSRVKKKAAHIATELALKIQSKKGMLRSNEEVIKWADEETRQSIPSLNFDWDDSELKITKNK